jgi:hypothetical protein
MRFSPLLFLALVAAASTQEIQWHAKGIVATTQATLSHTECDDAMTAKVDDAGVHIELTKNGFSNALLKDQFDYAESAGLQIKVDDIKKGALTVQAVCYDDKGQVFTSVDLLEYLEQPGTFEVPMHIYRTPLKETRKIAFRLWLSGDHPAATVSSVAYGTKE